MNYIYIYFEIISIFISILYIFDIFMLKEKQKISYSSNNIKI